MASVYTLTRVVVWETSSRTNTSQASLPSPPSAAVTRSVAALAKAVYHPSVEIEGDSLGPLAGTPPSLRLTAFVMPLLGWWTKTWDGT